MRSAGSDIADFYQQLALLVRASLPLPEGLQQLGRDLPRKDFREAVLEVGQRVSAGGKLADAMKRHEAFFTPFHIRLVTAGESTGTLPDVLYALARYSRFTQLMSARLRDILAYPLTTLHMCCIVLLFLSIHVIPEFRDMFQDILEGRSLPMLTGLVAGMGMGIAQHKSVILPIYAVLLLFSIWLFLPGTGSRRTLIRLLWFLPGAMRIVNSLDAARLSSIWATFFRQGMPLVDALEAAGELVTRRGTALALRRAGEKARAGCPAVEALAGEPAVDKLIVLTFKHAPQDQLADEFEKLAELYEHRVAMSAKSAFHVWTLIMLMAMIFCVGLVVISLFLPLLSIITSMCA